jgi:hypothetical protein
MDGLARAFLRSNDELLDEDDLPVSFTKEVGSQLWRGYNA